MKLLTTSCFCACVLALPCAAGGPGGELEDEPAYMGRTLRQWIADLKDADTDVRRQSAYRLARMGPRIRSAFPALKIALKDSDRGVRHHAAEALGYTGPQALPILMELLESDDSRDGALSGLQHLEPDPLPELLKLLRQGEPSQRRAVAAALRSWSYRAGDFLPAMRLALKDSDALVRIEAMEVVRRSRPNQSVPLEFVFELLRDKDPEIRLRAFALVGETEAEPETVLPAVEKLLNDADKRVRTSAAGLVGQLDSTRSPAMLAVARESLKDVDEAVRERALSAIYQIAHERDDAARSVLPDLLALLRDYKRQPKKLVLQVLGNLSMLEPDSKELVPLLMTMVRDADPEISEQAAHALAYRFPGDPAVRSMLPDSFKRVPYGLRREAMAAFLTLKKRPENVVSGLVDLLQTTGHPAHQSLAAYYLGELGAEAREAIPALHRALEDKNAMVRESAVRALFRIEPDRVAELTPAAVRVSNWLYSSPEQVIETLSTRASEVTPILVQGFKDPDQQYRLRAGLLLVNLRREARSVVPELRVALEYKEPEVRILAAAALARINPQTEGIVPVLRSGLAFNDLAVRAEVFNAIQEMGPAARELAPDLIRVLKNKSDDQFHRVASALQSIRPASEDLEQVYAPLVKDSDLQVRYAALGGLGGMKLKDKALLKTLLDMVHDDPKQLRNLDEAIRRFGAAASEELSKRLNDEDPLVREAFLNLYLGTGGVNHDQLYAILDRALKDIAPNVRLMAASRLVGMDRESNKALEQVLPVIKQCLESSDVEVRRKAIGVLGQVAGRPTRQIASPEITSLLVDQTKAKNASIRLAALGTLTHMEPRPKEVEPLLTHALKDRAAEVRRAAIRSIQFQPGRTKEAVSALIALLRSKDDNMVHDVMHVLARAGREDPAAVAALIDHYRTLKPGAYARTAALSALRQCGANAKDAIPLCVEALKDEDDNLVQTAVQTRMQLDPTNKMLVSALVDVHGRDSSVDRLTSRPSARERAQKPLGAPVIKELCSILVNDKEADRRAGAAIVLGTMVQDAKSAESALETAMKDAEPRVRLQAADACWMVSKQTRTPMPVLLALLKEKDARLRQRAAQVVAEMGKEASFAVPQLVEALKDQDDSTAGLLIYAFSQMGRDAAPAIPALVDIVREGGNSSWTRTNAARALMPFGREAKEAVPGLLDMLKKSERDDSTAVMALAKIATPAEALPGLLEVLVQPSRDHREIRAVTEALIQFGPASIGAAAELLQHERSEVRIRAIDVLRGFGNKVPSVLPQLLDAMNDKDDDVAFQAAEAVWGIGRRAEVLPYFVRGLKAKTVSARVRAARDLRRMGTDAKASVPDLVAAYQDRDSSVRREVYQTLLFLDRETAKKLGDPEADGK